MALRLEFPYGSYLASNQHLNRLAMQYLWEGENIKDSGWGGLNMKKDFPEIVDFLKHLTQIEDDLKPVISKLDDVTMARWEIASHQPGVLTLRFMYVDESKGDSRIAGVLKPVINMYFGVDAEGISFSIRKGSQVDRAK